MVELDLRDDCRDSLTMPATPETWLPGRTDGVTIEVNRYDRVTQRLDLCHVDLGPSGIAIDPLALRHVWPSELDLMARLAGLRRLHRWAAWAGEPFDNRSLRHISVHGR